MENEELLNANRNLTFIFKELEAKFDSQLEELELMSNELEEQKTRADEQIERLKEQLSEALLDCEVKDRELKKQKPFIDLGATPKNESRVS